MEDNARVYIGLHHGTKQYLLGQVVKEVFVDDVGGPCPTIPLSAVELQNDDGEWRPYTKDKCPSTPSK